uniref:VOC domain-containing protein n=1 Tax=Oryza punctata TaxID=4537 RepID=A0A0E0KC01_ORYPU
MTMTMSNEQGKPDETYVEARGVVTACMRATSRSTDSGGRTRTHKRELVGSRKDRTALHTSAVTNHSRRVTSVMASEGAVSPAFAYTVVYVKDVPKSAAFYSAAFGYTVRRLDQSHKWAELESGATTIAFTPLHQRETDALTGAVQLPDSAGERGPVEICFDYADVDAAYRRAVDSGAVPVSPPEQKSWGQKVGYVRDIDGIIVRMGSHVRA